MDKIFRDYHETDYDQCQLLVENAWDFERNFRPRELATLAGLIYTKGSVLGSNYQKIVAIEGKVAGFIFGNNTFSNVCVFVLPNEKDASRKFDDKATKPD